MRIRELIRTIDLFEDLTPDDLEQVCHAVRERVVRAGEAVCAPGQPCDAMFVVVEGYVEIETQRLGSGEVWGETGLISGESATYTATALADTRLVELDRDSFEALVAARPAVMRSILGAVSRRAAQANQRLLADDSCEANRGTSWSYAVYSPRGGAGKTLIAVRLALELSRRTKGRAALFDLDLLFDDAALQLELAEFTALGAVADNQVGLLGKLAIPGLVSRHASGLSVLVAASCPEDGERVTAAHVRAALKGLKRQFVATVVDCSNTYSEPILAALEMADRVLVICTPELTTLRDVREMQRLFGQALHLNRQRLLFVLNHPSPMAGLTRQQFENALEEHVVVEIEHGGEDATKSKLTRAIAQLAEVLEPPRASQHHSWRLPVFARGSHGP